jgi:hypothetical protein
VPCPSRSRTCGNPNLLPVDLKLPHPPPKAMMSWIEQNCSSSVIFLSVHLIMDGIKEMQSLKQRYQRGSEQRQGTLSFWLKCSHFRVAKPLIC